MYVIKRLNNLRTHILIQIDIVNRRSFYNLIQTRVTTCLIITRENVRVTSKLTDYEKLSTDAHKATVWATKKKDRCRDLL
jgi:hypothetical protein